MRRPEGFDPSRNEHAPPAPSGAPAKPRSDESPQPTKKSPVKDQARRVRLPQRRVTEAQLAARAARAQSRAARSEARRAVRDRRRFERAEVRRFTRRARNRRVAWWSAAGVVAVLGALIAVAVYSPLLALKEVAVTGATRLDPAAIQAAAEGQLGTPLALLDYDQLTSDLSAFSLIRSYVTEAVPPHTLVIHVTERQPVASVLSGDEYILVDPAGIEIERTDTRPAGVPLLELNEDQLDDPVFDAVIEVLLVLPAPLLAQVDQVSATTMDDVTLVVAGGQRVVWGSADRSELKARVLERLMAVHDPSGHVEFDVTAPLSAVVRPL
jgi:cell division protein FtsQ